MESAEVESAVAVLRAAAPRFFESGPPVAHLVLGSGLSALADRVTDAETVPFAEVPGFPPTAVAGHSGAFHFGVLGGRRVMVQAGRVHLYEGHRVEQVVAPVRLGAALGSRVLILTNAAGGIGRNLTPGSAMVIDDHINLMWRSPLAGRVVGDEGRFPDMSQPYDRELQNLAHEMALELGVTLERGVYAGVLGPSYETPAEIQMLARLGADAVGMSTVPEAIVAAALGVRVLGFSMISNLAAGLGPPLSHAEVMDVGRESGDRLGRVIEGVLARL
jgi:purine-nucleoside phosphorylase